MSRDIKQLRDESKKILESISREELKAWTSRDELKLISEVLLMEQEKDETDEDFEARKISLILEKVKCDDKCMGKYKAGEHFKGKKGSGERFDSYVKAFTDCCSGAYSPEGLCATINPAGKAKK